LGVFRCSYLDVFAALEFFHLCKFGGKPRSGESKKKDKRQMKGKREMFSPYEMSEPRAETGLTGCAWESNPHES
jgi:hypothetical protein